MKQNKHREQGSVVVIVAVVVLILVTFFVFYRPKLKETTKVTSNSSTEVAITSNNDSNLNTYSNSEYNFLLDYPKDWDFINSADTFLMLDFYPISEGPPDHGTATRVTLSAMRGKNGFTSTQEWTEVVDYFEIDGVQAELRKHKVNGSKYVFFNKNDIYYEVDPHILDFDINTVDDPQIESVFNMIVSSFKFIN